MANDLWFNLIGFFPPADWVPCLLKWWTFVWSALVPARFCWAVPATTRPTAPCSSATSDRPTASATELLHLPPSPPYTFLSLICCFFSPQLERQRQESSEEKEGRSTILGWKDGRSSKRKSFYMFHFFSSIDWILYQVSGIQLLKQFDRRFA